MSQQSTALRTYRLIRSDCSLVPSTVCTVTLILLEPWTTSSDLFLVQHITNKCLGPSHFRYQQNDSKPLQLSVVVGHSTVSGFLAVPYTLPVQRKSQRIVKD